jgi:hypothetical protein
MGMGNALMFMKAKPKKGHKKPGKVTEQHAAPSPGIKKATADFVIIIALLTSIFLYAFLIVHPELIYHIQQPAFLVNRNFLNTFLTCPGGISEYSALFISRFFYSRLSGAITITLISLLIIIPVRIIAKPVLTYQMGNLIMILPFILLLPLLNDYLFPLPVLVQTILVLTAIALAIHTKSKKWFHYLQLTLIQVILYYFAGGGAFMLLAIAVICIAAFRDSFKKSISFIIIQLIFLLCIPFLGYRFIFNISLRHSFWGVMPDLPVMLQYKPGTYFYIFYSMPLLISLVTLVTEKLDDKMRETKIFRNSRFRWSILLFAILLLAFCAGMMHKKFYSVHKLNIALTDYYCYHEKWNKVTDIALDDPEYDISINLCYNRAITNTGRFLEQFFDYPQYLGADILFPDENLAGDITMQASDYYYDLGYISESRHMAYEAQTLMPYNPRILKRLIETNIISRNYAAAGQFLEVLKQNPLYRDYVNKYAGYVSDTMQIAGDNNIPEKRKLMPLNEITYPDISERLKVLISRNFLNQRAFEHLQIFHLLKRKLGDFMFNLPNSLLFYKTTPVIYEEGILLFSFKTGNMNIHDYRVSDVSQKTYTEMQQIIQQFGNNPMKAKKALYNYRNTYLYYLLYISPEATKAIVKRPY